MKQIKPGAVRALFGANVRKLRLEMELSQEALADLCQLHRTYIGSIERGERNVSLDNVARIALALKVSIAELFAQSEAR